MLRFVGLVVVVVVGHSTGFGEIRRRNSFLLLSLLRSLLHGMVRYVGVVVVFLVVDFWSREISLDPTLRSTEYVGQH